MKTEHISRKHRRSHAIRVALLALVAMSTLGLDAAETKGKLTREYDLKAVFLFNFAQFVEWPPDAFPDEKTPFAIGVLGEDPFGKSLDEIVTSETIRGRKIVVRPCRTMQEAATCHIVFISRSEAPRLNEIFEFLDGKSVLTVGETDGFSTSGGMIGFLVVQNRLQMKVNVVAARAAKLTISSKLLRQAEIVGAKQGQ